MIMETIALLGAGGKMGCRITDNLKDSTVYRTLYLEVSEPGIKNLSARGLSPTPSQEAIEIADVVIFAIPDNLIERVSAALIPAMKKGALVMTLDPAAPCAGRVFRRDDLSYFVTHPCHPPVFNDEAGEARRDFFGGIKAKQNIVCALMQGEEIDYERGVRIAREIFKPVMRAHRVTVEQMAILEPGLSETTSQTCLRVVREALDEVVRRGVPEDAARDFLLGHINIQLAIFFNEIEVKFSDGATKAMDRAHSMIIQPDWKRVFDMENIRESLEEITRAPAAK
jgi:D-apionate oxidoisomerase